MVSTVLGSTLVSTLVVNCQPGTQSGTQSTSEAVNHLDIQSVNHSINYSTMIRRCSPSSLRGLAGLPRRPSSASPLKKAQSARAASTAPSSSTLPSFSASARKASISPPSQSIPSFASASSFSPTLSSVSYSLTPSPCAPTRLPAYPPSLSLEDRWTNSLPLALALV